MEECNKTKLLSLIVILFVSVCADATQKRTYRVREGEYLFVVCNISVSKDTHVYWTKNDTQHPFTVDGINLEIFNIKRSFSGDYICHALNTSYPVPGYNRTVEVINVDVQYPGEVDQFYASPSVLLEDETLTLVCSFQGNPAPNWLIGQEGGRDLATMNWPTTSTVTKTATCLDTGVWLCTGYNSLNHGVNATRKQYVTVHCPPRPQYDRNEYSVEGKIGRLATFVMNLWANPRPDYTWTKDDGTDISGFTRQYDYPNKTMLTFDLVSIPAFGKYTLKMQNQYGTYYAHYQLYGTPETPQNLGILDITYNSVTLHWTSGFDMGSKQHFTILKLYGNSFTSVGSNIYDTSSNHGINQKWTYVLTGLASSTFYNLTIASENEFGRMSGFARPVYFWTSDDYEPTSDSPENVNVALIVGLVCGSLGLLGFAAFLVYIIKYRHLRTSYEEIRDKPRKI